MNPRALLLKLGPLLGLLLIFLFFLIRVWTHTGLNLFATAGNLQTIALQSAIVGMAGLGMTMIIVSGGIDLSMGSTVALTSVAAAALLKFQGWPAFPAACGAVLVGGFCGLINGLLITQLRVVPFIVTLGTMLMVRGAAKGMAHELTINPRPERARLAARRQRGAAVRRLAPGLPGRGRVAAPPLHEVRPARVRGRLERGGGATLRRADHAD